MLYLSRLIFQPFERSFPFCGEHAVVFREFGCDGLDGRDFNWLCIRGWSWDRREHTAVTWQWDDDREREK